VTIAGANSDTYQLVVGDVGKFIRSVVTATNSAAPSGVVGTSVITSTVMPIAPVAPTALSSTPGDGFADIAFTAGLSNGAAITNYQYSIDGTTYTALNPADATSPIRIPGLTNGVTYSVTLKAVNTAGASVASTAVQVTPADVSAPTFVSATLAADGTTLTVVYSETLSATTAGTSAFLLKYGSETQTATAMVVAGNSVVLTFSSPVDQGKVLRLDYTDPTSSNDSNSVQDSAGNDAISEANLPVTNNSTFRSPPAKPSAPTAVAGNTSATVTVSAPTSGGVPTSYLIEASPQVNGATRSCAITGASGSCVVNGLTNGVSYTFTATAQNVSGSTGGTSSPSNQSAAVTPMAPPAPTPTPTPPTPTPEPTPPTPTPEPTPEPRNSPERRVS
jgi:hypothetical protein